MSKHRLEPPPRVRPRYGRIGAAALSLMVTVVALLAAVGVIPIDQQRSASASGDQQARVAKSSARGAPTSTAPTTKPIPTPVPTPSVPTPTAASTALPDDSGTGRRVVFDQSDQRVWLVDTEGDTVRTYLVSGSLTDNLKAGTYNVYSRSRWAVGIDDSGVMQYFVRFTRGKNAPIGFHSIPTKNGEALQTRAQLGTPLSHGCIRQAMPDAIEMWEFAKDGTEVVVTA